MSITSSIDDVDTVTKKISITVPDSVIADKVASELSKASKEAEFKGFRKGKAPQELVEKTYGARIWMDVVNHTITDAIWEQIREHKLKAVGTPVVDMEQFERGKDLKFSAKVSLLPEPQVKGYDKIKVKVKRQKPVDKDIDSYVDALRDIKATYRPLAFRNTAQSGDVIDAVVLTNAEGLDAGRPEPVNATLGKGELIPILEEALIGMETGTSKEIEHTIPDNHPNKNLRGKKVKSKVTLNTLSEKILPELNDEFVQTLKLKPQTVLELRMFAKETLDQKFEDDNKQALEAAALDELVAKHEFEVPQVMIDNEIRNMLVRTGAVDPQKIEIDKINIEPFQKEAGPIALKRVRTALLIDKIAQLEKIKPAEEDTKKFVADLAAQHQVGEEAVQQFFFSPERRDGSMAEITRSKALEWFVGKVDVTWEE